MTERKESLERRIAELLGEREGLSYNLDETSEKILMLERHAREQDNQVRTTRTVKDERGKKSSLSEY